MRRVRLAAEDRGEPPRHAGAPLAERYISDERLLATLELHDRPYALWRRARRTGRTPDRGLDRLAARIPDLDLFLRFVELDGSTEGKQPEPIDWIRNELAAR